MLSRFIFASALVASFVSGQNQQLPACSDAERLKLETYFKNKTECFPGMQMNKDTGKIITIQGIHPAMETCAQCDYHWVNKMAVDLPKCAYYSDVKYEKMDLATFQKKRWTNCVSRLNEQKPDMIECCEEERLQFEAFFNESRECFPGLGFGAKGDINSTTNPLRTKIDTCNALKCRPLWEEKKFFPLPKCTYYKGNTSEPLDLIRHFNERRSECSVSPGGNGNEGGDYDIDASTDYVVEIECDEEDLYVKPQNVTTKAPTPKPTVPAYSNLTSDGLNKNVWDEDESSGVTSVVSFVLLVSISIAHAMTM